MGSSWAVVLYGKPCIHAGLDGLDGMDSKISTLWGMDKKVTCNQQEGAIKFVDVKKRLEALYWLNVRIDTYKNGLECDRAFFNRIFAVMENNKRTLQIFQQWEASIQGKIATLIIERENALQILANVGDEQNRQLLYKRYAEGKAWHIIATEMSYSETHIQRIHRRIIQTMEAR